MTSAGSDSTCLVILRGDAASGKTTTATALRQVLHGRRVALISQDHFRREVLHDPDRRRLSRDASTLNIGAARQALDFGYDVILDRVSISATIPTSSNVCISITSEPRSSTSSTSASTRRFGVMREDRSRPPSERTSSAHGTTDGSPSPGSKRREWAARCRPTSWCHRSCRTSGIGVRTARQARAPSPKSASTNEPRR
ncbi:zeta toxin family protein [Microbacterium sp. J1-1]|uniref:zeta toxin family protein n=1 Tax=Microbacterium sp. J1-1 TaxID=2992441 RepID=UPI002114A058|nr:zeta toxin family protein [Microbacterium sp. J1-1]UUE22330.1 zeta toxin family protein [Microbacterium sp. J1-1]